MNHDIQSEKNQQRTRNVKRFCFTRAASSPAIVVQSRVNDDINDKNDRVADGQIKEGRNEMRKEWEKMGKRHVSFDECAHVLTKCAIIDVPLKNSAWIMKNSKTTAKECCDCTKEHSKKHERLSGTRVTFSQEEMLHTAVLDHDVSELHRLCQQCGANVNKKLSNGLTPLHTASIEGCFRIVQYILKQGAHVDERDDHGWTALHYASLHGNVPCALALLRAGADIYARTVDHRTAIELASEDEMILLLGRMYSEQTRRNSNQNKETYV